jgi:hypothetical protein
MADKPSVLFVCVHNAGRSQMAAGYLNHLAGDRVEVRSAGSEPADKINPVAVEAMAEEGIDIAGEQPKILTSKPPMSSSQWAAVTPVPTTQANATKTGSLTTPQAKTSTTSGQSVTKSDAGLNS